MIELDSLIKKIETDYPVINCDKAKEIALSFICDGDQRLEINLQEWINNKPLTEIWIDEYCIPGIMTIRGNDDFISAYQALNLYIRDKEKGTIAIWKEK